MSRRIAVIFGAGPGLGAALAQALVPTHSLLLLSRSMPGALAKLGLKVADPDASILACPSDGSAESLKAALAEAGKKWPDGRIDVALSNAGPGYAPGGFLEQKEETMRGNMDFFVKGSFNFAQAVLPAMLPHGGTLIFTGATMGMRKSAFTAAVSP